VKTSGKIGPVLVTGSAGFLGRAVINALRREGEDVVALDIHTAAPEGETLGVTSYSTDIRDLDALRGIVRSHEVRAIVHLAGLVIPACRANPVLGAEVNIVGHLRMMELAREFGINRVVYTSSLAARARPPLDSPVNLYGVSKRCAEEIAKVFFLEYGITSVGLRPSVVYGPDRVEGETAAISAAMRAAAKGEAYEIPYSSQMCFQHIDEVCDIILRCLAAKVSVPVVSELTTEVHSTADVAAAIRMVVPDARITVSEILRPAPAEVNNDALRALLGSWPSVSLEEGARRTIEACRAPQIRGKADMGAS